MKLDLYTKVPLKTHPIVLNAKNFGLIPVNAYISIDLNVKSTEKFN